MRKIGKREPTIFMVSYMGEVALHETEDIQRALNEMIKTPRHTFVLLTKLPKDLNEKLRVVTRNLGIKRLPDNIGTAVSVENTEELWRIRELKKIKCHRKEVWFKPLLENISKKFSLRGIYAVRISGEKGRWCRPVDIRWVSRICKVAGKYEVPVIQHPYAENWTADQRWRKSA
jgi:protein gp37